MTPQQALAAYRRSLRETVTVRRYVGTGPTRTALEAVAQARVTGFQPQDLVGAIVQGDRKVIMLVDPSAAVPAGKVALSALLPLSTSDKVVVHGRELAILAPDDNTRRIDGTLIAIELVARG